MNQRIAMSLQRLENIRDQFGTTITHRIDEVIREAARLARRVRLCPRCDTAMQPDGTMYRCPSCGLCRDDSDEPTAEFAPPDEVET